MKFLIRNVCKQMAKTELAEKQTKKKFTLKIIKKVSCNQLFHTNGNKTNIPSESSNPMSTK